MLIISFCLNSSCFLLCIFLLLPFRTLCSCFPKQSISCFSIYASWKVLSVSEKQDRLCLSFKICACVCVCAPISWVFNLFTSISRFIFRVSVHEKHVMQACWVRLGLFWLDQSLITIECCKIVYVEFKYVLMLCWRHRNISKKNWIFFLQKKIPFCLTYWIYCTDVNNSLTRSL